MSALGDVITMVTGCFASVVSWVPIQAAAGFAVVGAATGGVSKIIGIRKGRRRGR